MRDWWRKLRTIQAWATKRRMTPVRADAAVADCLPPCSKNQPRIGLNMGWVIETSKNGSNNQLMPNRSAKANNTANNPPANIINPKSDHTNG